MSDPLPTGGVDAAGAGPGLDVPRWFYVIHGRRLGPISTVEMTQLLLRGPYDPQMLVWRQGMLVWTPVSLTPELLLPGLSPRVSPPPVPLAVISDERRRRNAKHNCIVAAGLLIIVCTVLFVGAIGGSGGTFRSQFRAILSFSMLPGLYMTIYLPLRFRVIQSLPLGYRIAGLTGGIGLILLFWGSLLLSV